MIDNLITFSITMMILSVTPGPCMTLALNSGLTIGVKKTQLIGLGDYIGLVLYTIVSAVGLGIIISKYPNIIKGIQYIGALYIIYLGYKSIKSNSSLEKQTINDVSNFHLLKIGFISVISNPKAILFYSAFFPQFLNPSKSLSSQLLVMIPIVVGCEFISINIYAIGGKSLSKLLKDSKLINIISGSLLIFVGLWLGLK